jgi:hypothetical protein
MWCRWQDSASTERGAAGEFAGKGANYVSLLDAVRTNSEAITRLGSPFLPQARGNIRNAVRARSHVPAGFLLDF